MIPSKKKLAANLRDLRNLIDSTKDPCEFRIAYAMEVAIRWATEDTVGWQGMGAEAREMAKILREETKNETPRP